MSKRTEEGKMALGSGNTYVLEYDPAKGMPSIEEFCKPENQLGKTKGGAQLTYATTHHSETDDLGTVEKDVITAESATLKLGVITFNGKTIARLVDRCKTTEANGRRTIHIGGASNSQKKQWAFCFAHEDEEDGNIWVRVRGSNQAGLTLAFAVDAATKLEPEIKALPCDSGGTLIIYDEEIDNAAPEANAGDAESGEAD